MTSAGVVTQWVGCQTGKFNSARQSPGCHHNQSEAGVISTAPPQSHVLLPTLSNLSRNWLSEKSLEVADLCYNIFCIIYNLHFTAIDAVAEEKQIERQKRLQNTLITFKSALYYMKQF